MHTVLQQWSPELWKLASVALPESPWLVSYWTISRGLTTWLARLLFCCLLAVVWGVLCGWFWCFKTVTHTVLALTMKPQLATESQ